jgi:hypothetical protein
MTRMSKKDYIIAAVNLSVEGASTGADQWRGPPNTLLQGPVETPGSNPRIHLNNDA